MILFLKPVGVIYIKKTKEMLIGQLKRNSPPLLTLDGTEVKRVTDLKA